MRAKKNLGQNFLKSQTALNKIVDSGKIKSSDTILEIGPGKGALTEKLLARAGKVIAVEKDRELFAMLEQKFAHEIKNGTFELVCGDILDFEIEEKNYKVIANIPYNITGAILKKFLTQKHQPSLMVLLVQREVAQRILARDGKESILSISVKAYSEPKMVGKVEKRYFTPAPKVDSAIIKIDDINRRKFTDNRVSEERFWQIVRAGFAHKRKKLSSNLKSILVNTSLNLENKRAEELSVGNWLDLAK